MTQAHTLTADQAWKAAKIMQDHYGSFASAISCAYMLADQDNKERLLQAFGDLFQRVHDNYMASLVVNA